VSEGQAGSRFVFEINEDDDRIFRKMSARDLRRYLDQRIIKGIPVVGLLILMGTLLVAYDRGVLPLSALNTAEASFVVCYAAVFIAGRMALPRVQRALFRETSNANRRFDCTFDDDSIVIKIGLRETRMPWRAIARVEDAPSMVIFWYQPTQGYFVPSRAFTDDAARAAFAAWAAARVQAAAGKVE
jgi:hypothetical protein